MVQKGPRNKKTQVYEMIKERIINIDLKPGLPINEALFAEDLGVSKTPIREALRQLEQEGFVDNVPGRGSTISHITQHEIKDIFELRQIIETGVAAKAADFRGNAKLKVLKEDCEKILSEGENLNEHIFEWGSIENIHEEIVESLQNEYLNSFYRGLMERMLRIQNYFGQRFTQRRFHDISTEHLEILSAILDGDKEKAAQSMQEHLINAGSFVMNL